MSYKAEFDFNITLVPMSMPCSSNEDTDKSQYISSGTISIVRSIYEAVNNKFLTSRNSNFIRDKINNSVFGCCFDDGMAMFTFVMAASSIRLTGFFIPKKYLRTAWKMFREELIYLSARGMNNKSSEPFTLTPDEIYEYADKVKVALEQDMLKSLENLINEVNQASAPYSFTNTAFPSANLPVVFEKSSSVSPEGDEKGDDGIIHTYPNLVNAMSNTIKMKYPQASRMYLCCDTRKNYLALKKEEIKATCSKISAKKIIKQIEVESEAKLDKDNVWFFKLCDTNVDYVTVVDEQFRNYLRNNTIKFEELLFYMRTALLEIRRNKTDAQEEAEVLEEIKSSKKKSGFGGFFGRK